MYNKNKPLLVLLLLAYFFSVPVFAADSKLGEAKAGLCAGCHGQGGKSSNPLYPNLAAQQQTYIVNQLKAFKSGNRKNPLMQGMAAGLNDGDMANLAAYFFGQPPAKAGGDPALAKIGKEKAVMCLGCHGQTATGGGPIPRLAGQHPAYLITQLKHFKAGERQVAHMQAIARTLSEDDMKAVAAYFGSL